jgi:hypothetical protein
MILVGSNVIGGSMMTKLEWLAEEQRTVRVVEPKLLCANRLDISKQGCSFKRASEVGKAESYDKRILK